MKTLLRIYALSDVMYGEVMWKWHKDTFFFPIIKQEKYNKPT